MRWQRGALQGPLGRRIACAAEVFHDLDKGAAAAQVVVTGGVVWGAERECDAMRTALLDLHVPASRILTEPHARSTRENAAYTAALLQPYLTPGDALTLVTSDWHAPRAHMLFQAANLDTSGAHATDEGSYPQKALWHVRERVATLKDRALLLAKHLGPFPVGR